MTSTSAPSASFLLIIGRSTAVDGMLCRAARLAAANHGADVAKLLAHPLVGRIRGELTSVQGAAGVASRAPGHCATAGGDEQWPA